MKIVAILKNAAVSITVAVILLHALPLPLRAAQPVSAEPDASKPKAKVKPKPKPAAPAETAAFMGDYEGKQKMLPRESPHVAHGIAAAQVIALGGGEHRVNLLDAFDRREKPIAVLTGKVQDAKLVLSGEGGWSGVIEKGVLSGSCSGIRFTLKKVTRLSAALGAKPPAGAIVLLGPDTRDLTVEWERAGGRPCKWKLLPGGVMECVRKAGSIITKRKFTNQKIHVEFRTPFQPSRRGQGRGNSGVYVQGRYEVQVLDSYGLEGRSNECGGIYKVAAPRVNMCAPPMQWQSYDITFHAPVAEGDKIVKPALMSVVHNGVKIHENVKVSRGTTAGLRGNPTAPGGIYLQDHGHPVQYRNIWVVKLKAAGKPEK